MTIDQIRYNSARGLSLSTYELARLRRYERRHQAMLASQRILRATRSA